MINKTSIFVKQRKRIPKTLTVLLDNLPHVIGVAIHENVGDLSQIWGQLYFGNDIFYGMVSSGTGTILVSLESPLDWSGNRVIRASSPLMLFNFRASTSLSMPGVSGTNRSIQNSTGAAS